IKSSNHMVRLYTSMQRREFNSSVRSEGGLRLYAPFFKAVYSGLRRAGPTSAGFGGLARLLLIGPAGEIKSSNNLVRPYTSMQRREFNSSVRSEGGLRLYSPCFKAVYSGLRRAGPTSAGFGGLRRAGPTSPYRSP